MKKEKLYSTEEEIIAGLRQDCISCGNVLKQLSPEQRAKYAEYVLDGVGFSARTNYLILYKMWNYRLFVKLLAQGDDAVECYLRQCANKSIRRILGDASTRLSLFKDIIFGRGKGRLISMLKIYDLFDGEDEANLFRCQKNADSSVNSSFIFNYIKDNKLYQETVRQLTGPGYEVFLRWYVELNKLSPREKALLSARQLWNKFLHFLMLTE